MRFLVHFALGFIFAVVVVVGFAQKYGGDLTVLINVGEKAALRSFVELDIGPITTVPGIGHDGIFTYLIARDPFLQSDIAKRIYNSRESPSYRYKRVLLSWLGGGFGTLPAYATLIGILLFLAVGVGLCVAGVGRQVYRHRASPLRLLAVFLNPGILCGLITMTAEPLAMGLAIVAMSAYFHNRIILCLICCAMAPLCKEYFILTGISLAAISLCNRDWRAALALFFWTTVPIILWSSYVHMRVPYEVALDLRGNITWPFKGMAVGIFEWTDQSIQDRVFHLLVFCGILMSLIQVFRLRSLTYTILLAPWFALSTLLGQPVWDLGNNAARATCMVFFLALCGDVFRKSIITVNNGVK